METCDVLIIGGGPAGSSCAWGLRDSGLDIAILDKQVFPRDKVCGGWITPSVLTRLEINPLEYVRGRVLQPITGFRVGCIGGSFVEAGYGRTVSFGIRRREFDDYLLKRSGARILPSGALTSLSRFDNGWIANHEIRSRFLIGAGGHFCPVARLTGPKAGGETPVVAQETEFEMDDRQLAACKVDGENPELYFCKDLKGYGWCFRKGNVLNVGLGRADSRRLSTHVVEFLQFLKSAGRICFDIPSPHGHAYLLRGSSKRQIVGDRFLLIGDAAGVAYPLSGEGILPSIKSGLKAAASILAAHGSFTEESLHSHSMALSASEQLWLNRLAAHLPSQLIAVIGTRLLRTRWFAQGVVLDGWFLHPGSSDVQMPSV